MTYPDTETLARLEKLRAHLDATVERLASENPEVPRRDLFEEICISILDSEHADYPKGVLEEFLMTYLQKLNQ